MINSQQLWAYSCDKVISDSEEEKIRLDAPTILPYQKTIIPSYPIRLNYEYCYQYMYILTLHCWKEDSMLTLLRRRCYTLLGTTATNRYSNNTMQPITITKA